VFPRRVVFGHELSSWNHEWSFFTMAGPVKYLSSGAAPEAPLLTHAGAEIDLIIDRGSEKIGYEFKCSVSVVKRDWTNLQAGIEQGVIQMGVVVYMGERDFPVTEAIRVVNGENVLIS